MEILAPDEVVKTFSDPLHVAYLMLVAIVYGVAIAWTYRRTGSVTVKKYELESTLIIIAVITTLVIMVIGDSIARAIGVFGAFSIIRFRTAIKNPRDTAFIFFSLAAGLAAGANALVIGTVGVFIICALVLLIDLTDTFGLKRGDYILSFNISKKRYADARFKEIMDRYVRPDMRLNIAPEENGKVAFTFSISLNNKRTLRNFVEELSSIKGVSGINVSSAKEEQL